MRRLRILAAVAVMAVLLALGNIAVTGSAAEPEQGLDFPGGNDYVSAAQESLCLPGTYEAVICLPSDYTARSGVLFGAYSGGAHAFFNFEIFTNGVPRIFIGADDETHTRYDVTFPDVNVCTGKPVHIAITCDYGAGVWKCYINGELKQTVSAPGPTPFTVDTAVALGGDLRSGNAQFFKGVIRKLALYKDVRTPWEVSQDAKADSFDTDNILCAYDLTGYTVGEYPEKLSAEAGTELELTANAIWHKDVPIPEDYDYSFAVLGDIQTLTYYYPEKLQLVFDWIRDHGESEKIEFCVGLGDITDKNKRSEYLLVAEQYEKLAGTVPFSIIRGNHDRKGSSSARFDKYITQEQFSDQITGAFDTSMRNTYRILPIGQVRYLFLNLDFRLEDEVLDWANRVISENPDCRVIVSTHIYVDGAGRYYEKGKGSSLRRYKCENNGQDLWDKVLSRHENVVMLLCGHSPSNNIYCRQQTGIHGNVVTEMLVNPQQTDVDQGGVGMVAMLYFSNEGKDLQVRYYSVIKDAYYQESNQFSVTLDVPYTVTFDANGGEGDMEELTGIAGEYTLPEVGFDAPEGMEFAAWSVDGEEKAVGDRITVTSDTAVTAVWKMKHVCQIVRVEKVEPTCTEGGKQAYCKCDGCGKFFEDAEGTAEISDIADWGNLEALGHDFADATFTAPKTCRRGDCGVTEGEALWRIYLADYGLWMLLAAVLIIGGTVVIRKKRTPGD